MITFNFSPFPTLTTDRLLLRAPRPEDDQALFDIRSNPYINEYLEREAVESIQAIQQTITNLLAGIANNEWIFWAICTPTSPRLIGNICLWHLDPANHRGEVGYELHPDYQGQGYMAEALRAVVNYGFDQLGLHSIEGSLLAKNTQSVRVLERQGFAREGYFKESVYYRGRYWDRAVYSLVKKG
ncbi:MAG: GNAT family protein [Bacteroidota bacterium]